MGSGLSDFGDRIARPVFIPYADIKGFPLSTVAGHNGRLIAGYVEDKPVLCLQGRIHLYEGYSPQTIAEIVKTLKLLGIKTLILTNAAGSLHKEMTPGTLMLIQDHLNLSGFNPLIGPNDERFGPRFPNMNEVYAKSYRDLAAQIAHRLSIPLHSGTYCMLSGPSFETPAEVKMCRILGADANGMSTVPEAVAAVWCGLKVLGISALTNYCTGIEGGCPTHAETLQNAAAAASNLTSLLTHFIGELNE